ncbi:hypothetical protein ESZ36_12420 [Colwellia demingiae]|uniref:Solute-binding protein family 3/N-terminal domain-containing protein n=1 Tax=Colwellia demingiae TaxID=89401 RepID=A0A5C6QGF0_9GAMM|nr:hypothetical protein [Colwellia demingiae]TWX68065.1 hypothetical protein ESZ36_12420 [Colwellia demingiae]
MFKSIILLTCVILSPYLVAETTLPKHLIFGYNYHPAVIQYHIPIIRQAYKNLGIATEFVAMPIERDLMQTSKGIIDGNVIKPLFRIKQYENLIAVSQPIDNARFVVFCRVSKPCNPNILQNPKNTILMGVGSKVFAYSDDWHAQVYKISDLGNFKELFESKKFDYFTYVLSQKTHYQHNFKNVKYFILYEEQVYHVLHKKYAFMQEQVNNAIKQILAERNDPLHK